MWWFVWTLAWGADPVVTAHLLEVVEELSEGPTAHLSEEQQARRSSLLEALASYTAAGQYPHNHVDSSRRTPVFVDEHGTHCAVGYLLAVDGRDDLVERTVAQDREGWLHELASPELEAWATDAGFALSELARIQPSYGFEIPEPSPYEDLGELERLLLAADDCQPLWSSPAARRLGASLVLTSGPTVAACLTKAQGERNSVELLVRLVRHTATRPEGAAGWCAALERSFLQRRSRHSAYAGPAAHALEQSCGIVVPPPVPNAHHIVVLPYGTSVTLTCTDEADRTHRGVSTAPRPLIRLPGKRCSMQATGAEPVEVSGGETLTCHTPVEGEPTCAVEAPGS